jgi:hypothetical protein
MSFRLKTTEVFACFFWLFASFTITANAQSNSVYDIAAGTKIIVSMDNEINSKVSRANDTFTATLAEPLLIRETIVLPVGTVIEGKITSAAPATAGGGAGKIAVLFQTLRLPDGTKRRIEGVLVKDLKAENSSAKLKTLTIAGAGAIGAIVGAILKSSSGALAGGGVGA